MYGIGQALLLVSEYTSPDSPCQWWEGHNTAETVGEKGSGTDIKINRHSTLSLVMRKEEASKAEVTKTLDNFTYVPYCLLSDCRDRVHSVSVQSLPISGASLEPGPEVWR